MVPRAVAFTIVWPEGVIFGSIMTYHVQFLLLVRQPLFDRAALPLTQTSWVLPPLSVGKMTLRLDSASNYSHGLSKGPSFGTGRERVSAVLALEVSAKRTSNTARGAEKLIAEMAVANITWGEERIAHELLVKLGVRVSPRTVRKYIPIRDDSSPDRRNASHRWATFVRNHAKAVVAADFFNVVTVSFRVLYVFVIMEIGTRKMLHFNVTAHPTAEWTLQQFREAIGCEHDYRFVIVDRDDKFSADLRRSVRGMGVRPLRTPRRAPQANAYCERLIGTTRRECLDQEALA